MISSSALDLVAFCALGAISETQQMSLAAVEAMAQADPEKVFAETLCLVATATARSATSAYGPGDPVRDRLAEALLAIPITLHSYVAGSEVLGKGVDADAIPDSTGDLERMLQFYSTHLLDGAHPDRKALRNAMILWMGRISPPGLNEHPEQRLDRLKLVDRLSVHTRLVEAYARNAVRTK